jgi:hypothetical protein
MNKEIILLVILTLTSPCLATFQAGDIVRYEGDVFRTPIFPLEQYGPIAKKEIRLEIEPNTMSTGNYRGYVATWEVQSNKLYLVEIDGWLADQHSYSKDGAILPPEHNKRTRATLESIFPSKVKENRVFSEWFTGHIFTPGHRWGASLSKKDQEEQEAKADLIISVERGIVIKVDDKRTPNKVPEDTARKLADPQH